MGRLEIRETRQGILPILPRILKPPPHSKKKKKIKHTEKNKGALNTGHCLPLKVFEGIATKPLSNLQAILRKRLRIFSNFNSRKS